MQFCNAPVSPLNSLMPWLAGVQASGDTGSWCRSCSIPSAGRSSAAHVPGWICGHLRGFMKYALVDFGLLLRVQALPGRAKCIWPSIWYLRSCNGSLAPTQRCNGHSARRHDTAVQCNHGAGVPCRTVILSSHIAIFAQPGMVSTWQAPLQEDSFAHSDQQHAPSPEPLNTWHGWPLMCCGQVLELLLLSSSFRE